MVQFYIHEYVTTLFLGPLLIMASIWVHHVQHRVYDMHPDRYAGGNVTEIEKIGPYSDWRLKLELDSYLSK